MLLGDIAIGDSVSIGAGAVVINDVPVNSVVAEIPARVVNKKE